MSSEPINYASPKYSPLDILVLNNVQITTSSTSISYYIGESRHAEVLISTGAFSGTTPKLTLYLNAVEPSSGVTVKQYAGTTLTSGSVNDYISVDGQALILGGTVTVSWSVSGTSPVWSNVYARLVAKGT